MRDFLELIGVATIVLVAAVGGIALMVIAIALPFAAIGGGIAIAAKLIMWALGWPA